MALRRLSLTLGAVAALAAAAATPALAQTTLRIALTLPAASLDPVQSTAATVRNHGFFIYDQLFGLDSKGVPRPQMVQSWTASEDKLTWRFTLREGLAFHDGQPVRAADAVASIRRWAQRDVVGRALAAATGAMEVVDDRTFEIRLSQPFGLVLEALARPTGSALFIMPERIAQTPPNVAITEAIGSGPFIFQASEWRAGDRAVYLRNPNYRPREEAPDGLAGSKAVYVDRVEWLTMPDATVGVNALGNGELDFLEQPPPDLIPTLERNRRVRVAPVNPVGNMAWLRLNHTQPPFNDPRARQALLYLINQKDVLEGMGIRPEEQVPYCPAYFMCGTPLETAAGAQGLREPDVARARELLRQAGYDGRPVVFMNATDSGLNNAATLVMAESFKRAGLNMDVQAMDWGTLTARRNRKEPQAQGGWNLFITIANAFDAENPLSNLYLASSCDAAPAGWPCDEELERLRKAWAGESDPARRRALLDQVHARAYEVLPYINGGQFRTNAAWRTNITGIRPTTVPVFWGVRKE
ncbi:ABC transporter substrate-binding protein [Roseomonas sp. SSH11]|uniref:ABC transporter substrate-binding protein n=1 Tax=Pararoseomonas baculiformis TaxID=2820812 RepID=A0ABS4AC57_9PROT|nr:ABC transporter substrate-binding protein [Pararoseomonas baculiformis]MBP0444585.1 ABC transporter substrate-binding protein [Pararoseomonas baculiformis]